MKTQIRFQLFAAALLAITVSPLRAQIVADGATNTLSNVTNSIPGDVTVGTNGSFTLLILSENALLTNSANALIGLNSTAKSNEVRLISPGARWRMSGNLLVGSNGAMSRLVIGNGAFVDNNSAFLGRSIESSNNVVLVAGSGSLWSNRSTLTVGNSGRDNQLIVSNGGWVASSRGDVGGNASASNNFALVTGSGSVWSNAPNSLRVGANAPGNRLLIEAGGLVHSGGGTVGSSGSASNNLAWVTGPGSLWTNNGDLFVGQQIGFNRLVVSNGAAVRSVSGVMGSLAAAVSNQVVISGAGSVWSNQTTLLVGGNSAGNRADVTDGGWLACVDGSVGSGFSANSNTVVLAGGSGWNNLGTLKVGDGGSGNTLIANNGATVLSSNAFIGANTSLGNSNLALITGVGTLWSNRNDFTVGNFSVGNQLVVSNGAVMHAQRFSVVGGSDTASSNSVIVTGAGSRWVPLIELYVGSNGPANRLLIADGGFVDTRGAIIGLRQLSKSNEVVVDGIGSRWNVLNSLSVGNQGQDNRLVVTNGGTVSALSTTIGASSAGTDGEVLVTGTGSVLTNRTFLSINAPRSQLVVSHGGQVFAPDLTVLGDFVNSTNNRILVHDGTLRTGTLDVRRGTNVFNAGLIEAEQLVLTNTLGKFEFNGGTLITRGAFISNGLPFLLGRGGATPAVWDVRAGLTKHLLANRLIVGSNSSFNQVFISDGAVLDVTGLAFLAFNSGSNNELTVTGPGSTLNSPLGMLIGRDGNANRMTIGNGGKVFANVGSSGTFIGLSIGTSSNLVTVADPGSRWSVNDLLFVGSGGHANQLVVSNGATVDSLIGSVGSSASGSNNLAIVTGANSSWSNRSDLTIGSSGSGNRLLVSDGATVIQTNAYLGFSSSSRGNSVLVTGAGALLNSRRDLFVGSDGRSNRLTVSLGGTVVSGNGFLGGSGFSGGNEALVTDAGSVWSNGFDLRVGHECTFNLLVVSNQAQVLDRIGLIGSGTVGSENSAVVTGTGSRWSNSVDLIVGSDGTINNDNTLLVSSGGSAVAAGNGIIGLGAGALFNQAIVTEPLSRWEMGRDLFVGSNGAASKLVVSNGALVVNSNGFLGFNVSSDANFVQVGGAGSTWSNRGDLIVGKASKGNLLVVSDGARVVSDSGEIGSGISASNNVVVVTGPGSVWTNGPSLLLGRSGSGNQLVISNGATVRSGVISMAVSAASSGNVAVVTGTGSVLNATLSLGSSGSSNRLFVSDGGVVQGGTSHIGPSSFNVAVISGAGSVWTNSSELLVGSLGSGNQLVVSNSGLAIARSSILLGPNAGASSNRIEIDGGSLVVTNVGFGLFDLRRGTAVLNAGLIAVDRLLLTNVGGFLQFNGGTLSVGNSRVSNGTFFQIGNGVSPATMILAGNGLHEFNSILVATVSSNATFTGNGTIGGAVPLQFNAGSRLVPGASVGKMIFSNSPSLRGTVVMEISKDGATLTNDQIQVIAPLTYGGSLVVSNLGPTALAVGDRFPLFSANSYSGGFTNIILPPLPAGLDWTNKLSVDGSIEVIGLAQPKFTGVSLIGTNLTISGSNGPPNAPYAVLTATNVTLPMSNWVSIVNGQFDSSGNFSFTNAIAPGELQRYFGIRTP